MVLPDRIELAVSAYAIIKSMTYGTRFGHFVALFCTAFCGRRVHPKSRRLAGIFLCQSAIESVGLSFRHPEVIH
jgi:hypothetical protein